MVIYSKTRKNLTLSFLVVDKMTLPLLMVADYTTSAQWNTTTHPMEQTNMKASSQSIMNQCILSSS